MLLILSLNMNHMLTPVLQKPKIFRDERMEHFLYNSYGMLYKKISYYFGLYF